MGTVDIPYEQTVIRVTAEPTDQQGTWRVHVKEPASSDILSNASFWVESVIKDVMASRLVPEDTSMILCILQDKKKIMYTCIFEIDFEAWGDYVEAVPVMTSWERSRAD